jgi:hypothetical protein
LTDPTSPTHFYSFEQVAPLSAVKIPFSFFPTLINDHLATLTVTSDGEGSEPITWTFPLLGVSEGSAVSASETTQIRCRARERAEEMLSLPLDGLPKGMLAQSENFSLALECAGAGDTAFLGRTLTTELLTPVLTDGSTPLQVRLVFDPLKSHYADAFLVVRKESGGRWKFPLAFTADDCEVDDIISIEAFINTTSTVGFRLFNQVDEAQAFRASFTLESPHEFKVRPERGTLASSSEQVGQQFEISFSPDEYGKRFVGHLVIETEEMQWKYEIRGTNPRHETPVGASKLDTSAPEVLLKSKARQERKAERYTMKIEELKIQGRPRAQ